MGSKLLPVRKEGKAWLMSSGEIPSREKFPGIRGPSSTRNIRIGAREGQHGKAGRKAETAQSIVNFAATWAYKSEPRAPSSEPCIPL